jgi:nucleotide-binding universal stress UspA family protein
MKVLIGYDGSKDAAAALKELDRMGLPAGTTLHVLAVTTPWMPLVGALPLTEKLSKESTRIAEEALKTARGIAEKAAASLVTRHPAWRISAEGRIGDPAEVLQAAAKQGGFDLLLLGSHGRTALGRLLMGSVSHKLLHHVVTGLRIHRRRKPRRAGGPRLLVAVDGSKGSDAVIDAVVARSWPKGTRIKVVTALEGSSLGDALRVLEKSPAARKKEGWVEVRTREAARRLEGTGCAVTRSVKTGDPRLAILREAAEWDADCIFVGTRGLGRWEGWMLGSVSSAVANHAPCPVELVPGRAARRKSGR